MYSCEGTATPNSGPRGDTQPAQTPDERRTALAGVGREVGRNLQVCRGGVVATLMVSKPAMHSSQCGIFALISSENVEKREGPMSGASRTVA